MTACTTLLPGLEHAPTGRWRMACCTAVVAALALLGDLTFAPARATDASAPTQAEGPYLPADVFLDRLMIAESSGNDEARNPRSTATGPFQFIESTFLDIARRHFSDEIEGLQDNQILAKRTDRAFARRAAHIYTSENAAVLTDNGFPATSANLRLAFLLGANGAVRVLRAETTTPVNQILGSEVITANPFMAAMTAADLIRRAAYDLRGDRTVTGLAAASTSRGQPGIRIRCKLTLPSCRRWVALQQAKQNRPQRRASR